MAYQSKIPSPQGFIRIYATDEQIMADVCKREWKRIEAEWEHQSAGYRTRIVQLEDEIAKRDRSKRLKHAKRLRQLDRKKKSCSTLTKHLVTLYVWILLIAKRVKRIVRKAR